MLPNRSIASAMRASKAAAAPQASMDLSGMMAAINNSAAATNAFNADQAQLNRDFQLMMSNTAHQREMADLRAAGLNPILAARQGASTPSGGQASGADPSGAIAGLLGQVLSVQSAQAIAQRNNATAHLIEAMKERHDTYIHQNFPNSLYSALGAALTNPLLSMSGKELLNKLFKASGMDSDSAAAHFAALHNKGSGKF